jgi:hypothetical protein
VSRGEGKQLLRVLPADALEPPLRWNARAQPLMDAPGSAFDDFPGDAENPVGLADLVAAGGELGIQRMARRQ